MSKIINVLLIRPLEFCRTEPMGLMYLAAYVREHSSCRVRIFDVFAETGFNGRSQKADIEKLLKKELEDFKPDLVGISSMFSIYHQSLHDVAEIVKLIDKNVFVIAGGAHVSSFPEGVLKDDHIDAVVKGEGERVLAEAVNALSEGKEMSQVAGVMIKGIVGAVRDKASMFIEDLDTIPFPARDLVNMEAYFNDQYTREHSMRFPCGVIISSRGCPFDCVYCAIHCVWQHTYRMHGSQKVVDEIVFLVEKYGVREIAFYDDNLTFSKKRMIAICDEIVRRKIDIRWCTPNGVAISTLDEEVLAKMKRSGCYKLTFGIETGSLQTQKFIRKTYIDLKRAKEIISYCNKLGILTHSSFIIGFPFETEQDIMQTIDYATSCGLDMAAFYLACPYPGTDLYNIYRQEGLIPEIQGQNDIGWQSTILRPSYGTRVFTPAQLEAYRDLATKKGIDQ